MPLASSSWVSTLQFWQTPIPIKPTVSSHLQDIRHTDHYWLACCTLVNSTLTKVHQGLDCEKTFWVTSPLGPPLTTLPTRYEPSSVTRGPEPWTLHHRVWITITYVAALLKIEEFCLDFSPHTCQTQFHRSLWPKYTNNVGYILENIRPNAGTPISNVASVIHPLHPWTSQEIYKRGTDSFWRLQK